MVLWCIKGGFDSSVLIVPVGYVVEELVLAELEEEESKESKEIHLPIES